MSATSTTAGGRPVGQRTRLLLHCCCGPCAAGVGPRLRSQGEQVTGWYYNPNIFPPQEMWLRQQALNQACLALGISLLPPEPDPSPAEFLLSVAAEGGKRCRACYRLRLEATARKAKELGYEAFSTTLCVSPHQDLAAIREIGEQAGARHGVEFRFADLRHLHRESQRQAESLHLYRQNYCGCLFSGLERAEARALRAISRMQG